MESNRLHGVDPARREALSLLLSRYSVSPKYLAEPGPSNEELHTVALAALRAPDHEKLIPFRFVVVRDEGLRRLAELFLDYGRRHGKTGEALEAERTRALQAPVVIAVVAHVDAQNSDVPTHEQWACVGGAISNAVLALHMMGYGAKMLSGARAADPVISAAFCKPGETLVGWISAGIAQVVPKARAEIHPGRVLEVF